MANRRMFSLKVIDTDSFLDMPVSVRELYFQLGLRADDDGFVGNPRRIIKMVGASEDDMRVLTAKGFVIPFESGVCVIRHWKTHNYIQSDRYQETQFLEERTRLNEENGVYSIANPELFNLGYKMDTQVRLGKVRLGKDIISNGQAVAGNDINSLILLFKDLNPSFERLYPNKNQRSALERMIKKFGVDKMSDLIKSLPDIVSRKYAPQITTPIQLETKLGELKLFIQKSQQDNKVNIKI